MRNKASGTTYLHRTAHFKCREVKHVKIYRQNTSSLVNQLNQIVIAITIEENPELAMKGLMRGAFKELNQQHGPNSKHRGFFSQRLPIPMILTFKRKSHQVI